jgi:hypothetical protein
MSGSLTIPVVLGPSGRISQTPASLNAQIISGATAFAPGLTILPAGLIEDMASTATAATVIMDQAVTETIDSLTPYGANNYVLAELGQIYLGQGSTAASASNTSVFIVASGTAGFVLGPGFTVSDGTNQYTVTDGGIISAADNLSQPIFAAATQPGSFAVPQNSVTSIVTSVPSGIALSITNPLAGTPGGAAQTPGQYRQQVMTAGLVAATGMPNMLKSLLAQVPGVNSQLVSVRQTTNATTGAAAWEVIVGGNGDPNQIGLAIFNSLFDINTLTGSTLAVSGITNANPGVVTTKLNHGFTTGQVVQLAGVDPSGFNVSGTATVLTEKTFSMGANTTGTGAYVSGGVVTPNFRNVTATISNPPDSYTIPFVIPPQQTATMAVTWQTSSTSFVSNQAVTSLVQEPLADYINSLGVGQPINLLQLQSTFTAAVGSVLAANLITILDFTVSINGITTAPDTGTTTIFGDPESFFTIAPSSISVQQG